jgi:hypothetical protein
MIQAILDAFLEVRKRRSPDVVVADPVLNQRFLAACRRRKVRLAPVTVNRELLNARKAGYLRGMRSRRLVVSNQASFRFASEVAVRFLGRRDRVSLDEILCDPKRAREFDKIAMEIAPGFTSFQYRWGALTLRKARKLRPEVVAQVIGSVATARYRVKDLDIESIPSQQGVYIFHDSRHTLYVGEAVSLYKRVKKHLDHSDNKGLAHWLWQHGAGELHLEIHVLPKSKNARVRKALEAELIASRRPLFNIAGTG